ncbi:s-adenosylmethionine mitochondrial carrier protein, partial [Nannochloropsis gaditana CCMP526]
TGMKYDAFPLLLGLVVFSVMDLSVAFISPSAEKVREAPKCNSHFRVRQIPISAPLKRHRHSNDLDISKDYFVKIRNKSAGVDRRNLLKTASVATLGCILAGSINSSPLPLISRPSNAKAATRLSLTDPALKVSRPEPSGKAQEAPRRDASDTSSEQSSPLQEFLSGLAGGAASRASKELFLHPIDTWKTRLQYSKGNEAPAELFKNLYDGVWPALLVGTPAGAAFFATKDVLKGLARNSFGNEFREATTIAAVFAANIPYWLIRNPAEVLKTQQQTGLIDSTAGGTIEAVKQEGLEGLYRGYVSNIAYAFPTDAIKFVVYEALQKSFSRKLNPLESSVLGSAASSVAQLMSTPLDVVRTRIMTDEAALTNDNVPVSPASTTSVWQTARKIAAEEGVAKLFSGLFPRLTRAFLSGAIQFGSYELTKGAFSGKWSKK